MIVTGAQFNETTFLEVACRVYSHRRFSASEHTQLVVIIFSDQRRNDMKKTALSALVLASFATSGCAALLGAGVGAAAVTCAPDDVDCVEEVKDEVEEI